MADYKKYRQNMTSAQHARVSFAGKENIPPVNGKRTASIAGLFERPRSTGARKAFSTRVPLQPIDNLFPNARPGCPDVAQQIIKANHMHNLQAEQRFIDKNEEALRRILARLDGVDEEGKPLDIHGNPTNKDLDELRTNYHNLTRPIEADNVTIECRQPDGSVTHKLVLLSKNLDTFTDAMKTKCTQFAKLREELYQVQDEIETVHADIIDQKDVAYKHADDKLITQQAQHQRLLDQLKEEAAEEQALLKKKQKAETRKRKSDFEEAFKRMLEYPEDDD